MQDDIGGAIYIVNAGYTNALSGEDQRILIGQFTTDGEMSGRINVQMLLAGSSGVEEEILTFFLRVLVSFWRMVTLHAGAQMKQPAITILLRLPTTLPVCTPLIHAMTRMD